MSFHHGKSSQNLAGAIIDVLGSYTDPVIRAMIATCVPQEELGKVYALIATAECIVPLGVSQAYASLFKVFLALQDKIESN